MVWQKGLFTLHKSLIFDQRVWFNEWMTVMPSSHDSSRLSSSSWCLKLSLSLSLIIASICQWNTGISSQLREPTPPLHCAVNKVLVLINSDELQGGIAVWEMNSVSSPSPCLDFCHLHIGIITSEILSLKLYTWSFLLPATPFVTLCWISTFTHQYNR